MVKALRIVYANRFRGFPKLTDFDFKSEELPKLNDEEVLAEAICLSIDPGVRKYMEPQPIGATIIGYQVARVIESRNSKFPLGSTIVGSFGWRTHTAFHPNDRKLGPVQPYVLPDFGNLSPSLSLGVLGLTGITALYGLLDVCRPKAGETVVVTGAAGAVGSIVGQVAKTRGCVVVGVAGDDRKCELLRSLGFDRTINYKTADVAKALKVAAPDGIDCYFDNVGGALSSIIISQMRMHGRISVCGSISTYNEDKVVTCTPVQEAFVGKLLQMRGFHVHQFVGKWMEGIQELVRLVETKKIVSEETVYEGFEKMPEAFIDVLKGGNTGKAIVNVNLRNKL